MATKKTPRKKTAPKSPQKRTAPRSPLKSAAENAVLAFVKARGPGRLLQRNLISSVDLPEKTASSAVASLVKGLLKADRFRDSDIFIITLPE